MRVCIQQFLGTNHSWALVGQNIARALLKQGHEVDLCSTDGVELVPLDLRPHLKTKLDSNYDMQISYTMMQNFPHYLSHGTKNRFGIWNYETTVLPTGFAKYYKFTDKFLPSSEFSKKIFLDAGVPESHMVVVPHGADLDSFQNKNKHPLKTQKKRKILLPLGQLHQRKNIPGILEAYGRAFTNKDDICLVAKISLSKRNMGFEVNFPELLASFKKKYKNHAEIEVITDFIPNMVPLYNACDIVFSMAHTECFHLPSIEALAAEKINIAPRYGGQLDFLNDSNALLVDGKMVRAPKSLQYWEASPFASMFDPNVDQAAKFLRLSYDSYNELRDTFLPHMKTAIQKYNWDSVATQLLGLCV